MGHLFGKNAILSKRRKRVKYVGSMKFPRLWQSSYSWNSEINILEGLEVITVSVSSLGGISDGERMKKTPVSDRKEAVLAFILLKIFLRLKKKWCIWVFSWMCICVPHTWPVPKEARKWCQIPWKWSYSCELSCRCWEPNSGPTQEQSVP